MDSAENEEREARWHRLGEAWETSLSSVASMLWGASQIGRCVHVGVWGKPNHTIRTVPLPGCQFVWCGFCLAGTSDTFLGMYSKVL